MKLLELGFLGFRSTGGRNFCFPIDFDGHRYNSADATCEGCDQAVAVLIL